MTSSVGDSINAATRPYHTTLNQNILRFLPLALPPHSHGPQLYAVGISKFEPIYSTFESSLNSHISSSKTPTPYRALLQSLHTPTLERASALQHDLDILLPHLRHQSLATQDTESLSPQLQAFVEHMQSSLAQKPHLLLAYTWIFYMALFSGGRYIRSKLRSAFSPSSISPLVPSTVTDQNQASIDSLSGLSFWNFPGSLDGEDLKVTFKTRMLEISPLLSPMEQDDIVTEAVYIMTQLNTVVLEISQSMPAHAAATPKLLVEGRSAEPATAGNLASMRSTWLLFFRSLFPVALLDLVSAIETAFSWSATSYNAAVAGALVHVDGK